MAVGDIDTRPFGVNSMPRFFFDLDDGKSTVDDEGTDLPNLAAAKLAAWHLIGGLLCDVTAAPAESWWLQVRSDGRTVYSMNVSSG
jgi:hypothetical protein